MSQTSKIILTVIITAIVVGGGVYYWQQNKIINSSQSLSAPQKEAPGESKVTEPSIPQAEAPKAPETPTTEPTEKTAEEETPTTTNPEPSTQGSPTTAPANTESEKTFQGDGFSFTYPSNYIADEKGLWTEEEYQNHINPPENCDTCQFAGIEVKSETSDKTLDEQIIADFDLPGTTLKEMYEQTQIPYEQIKIGDNDFVKINVSENMDVTGYYTKNNNEIVSFKVYFEGKDNEILKKIISTLKFI